MMSRDTPSHGAQAATVAIAVWVKTPGYSPAKTRLAKAIGTPAAETFYRLAVDVVRELVNDACRLAPGLFAPYWAVAEGTVDAQGCWSGFPVVAQGEGGLGERLAHVYALLEPVHTAVLFIGADSPQLSPEALVHVGTLLAAPDLAPEFVLGPAADGGFYLFGGRVTLERAAWTGVTYSASTTMAELVVALEQKGRVRLLPTEFDVDTIDELFLLRDALMSETGGGSARNALREWLVTVLHP